MVTKSWGGLTVRLTGGSDGNGGGEGPVVVLLHGFGAPGDDLVPLGDRLGSRARCVFPAAPIALPSEYGPGRAWWNIDMVRLQMAMLTGQTRDMSREVPHGLAAAREKVVAMLAELRRELAIGDAPIWLGGFSQGAMLACDVALRTTESLAGVALMSGTLLCEDEWLPLMAKRAGMRALVSHGRQDPVLPFSIAMRLRAELERAGVDLRWVPFDGAHGIAPEVLETFASMLVA
ncbi:MAG: phospholipase [Deltaproteobacteria bacterium]|nr:phospholipase [Deltaproteobacteria bacterium]